ncbi:MAG: hypothetical protein JNM40_13675 [Myxococcales bacterium]|nr:hypothetical protein [Myxococcales bacterium]
MKPMTTLSRSLTRRGFVANLLALFALLSRKVKGMPALRRRSPASGWFGHC